MNRTYELRRPRWRVPIPQVIRSKLFDLLCALWTALFALAIPFFLLFGSPPRKIRAATSHVNLKFAA